MDYMVEEFDPFIFALNQNGIWLRIHANWYDGSELAKAKLEAAITSRKRGEYPFNRWLEKFNFDFLGTGPNIAKYVPSLEVVDPPQVTQIKAWLKVDGVKGDWEGNRTGCKTWKLDYDQLHHDVYTLLGARGLTLLCEEYLREYLLEHFQVLPSDKLSLGELRDLLHGDSLRLMPGEYEASDDFTEVRWNDENGRVYSYSFNYKQAKVVAFLAASKYPKSDEEIKQELSESESAGDRIRDVFKLSKNTVHEAWGTFIVGKGKDPVKRSLAAKRRIPS